MHRSSKQSIDVLKMEIHSHRQEQTQAKKLRATILCLPCNLRPKLGLSGSGKKADREVLLIVTGRCYINLFLIAQVSTHNAFCYNYMHGMQLICLHVLVLGLSLLHKHPFFLIVV
jgi:hypothetical protein